MSHRADLPTEIEGAKGSRIQSTSTADCCHDSPETRAHLRPKRPLVETCQTCGFQGAVTTEKYRPVGHDRHLDNHV